MIKIAVFASGRGSNFQTIHRKTRDGYISAEIVTLISDSEQAGALCFARENHISTHVVRPKDFQNSTDFGSKLLDILNSHQTDLVVLAGYLRKIPENVVTAFENRILNIHPALLPAFGGKGMYGMRVHEAVFRSGVHFSGVTVHLVNNEYDAGPIVLQRAVNIADCDSPAAIAERVLAEEHIAFPDALKRLIDNEYTVDGQRVILKGAKQ